MPDHRCRQGPRCLDVVAYSSGDGGRRELLGARLTGLGPDLCDPCSRAARWAVHDAPARIVELEELIADPLRAPASTTDPTMPRGTQTERPCELNLNADAAAREYAHELAVWASWVGEGGWRPVAGGIAAVIDAHLLLDRWDDLLSAPPATYVAHGTTRPLAVDTLTGWRVSETEGLVVERDGVSAACAFLALAHRAAVLCGRGPSRGERQAEPCPHCGATGTVVRTPPLHVGGPAPLRCEHCHRGIGEDHWDRSRSFDVLDDLFPAVAS